MLELTRTQTQRSGARRAVSHAGIAAVATRVPMDALENREIGARLGVTSDWIVKRTGIHARHVAAPDDRLTDFAAGAGADALTLAGVAPHDVDLVLVATTTADEVLPNAAPLVAHELGAVRAGAIDLGAACTGFLSGLQLATAMVESGRAEHVLLIGADLMTRITDPDCRKTAAVFGDGAGAALITASGPGGGRIGPVVLGADGGAGAALIRVELGERLIRMDGQETFRHAVARMAQATRQVLELAGTELEEIDLFVYHQANGRILKAVGEQLGLDPGRVVDCIAGYGNTSAATLPIALAHAAERGQLASGDRVLLGAFGAGFTWGAGVIEWH